MGQNESSTHALLKTHLTERVMPSFGRHGGRVVKSTGDGVLAEFGSTVGALSALIELQQAMANANRDEPETDRIVFRSGVHLGEVIVEDNDLYGDAVNIAARLQGEAPPGGILISRAVREAVEGRLKAKLHALGELSLKNIERPIRAFRVEWDAADWKMTQAKAPQRALSVEPTGPALALPDKPSIAVMPFQNMSGDPEQEYFADGMVEEIITALSRIRWLFVIARNSTFIYKGQAMNVIDVGKQLGVRYVLEGSVRKVGSRVRITGQLIDASSGAHVWADIFDGSLEDVFDLQAKVAGSVAGIIEPTLVAAEMHRVSQRPTSDATAYDLYLQALAHLFDWEKNSNFAALDLLRSAVDRDPNYGPALVLMGRCYFASDLNGWSQGNRDRALEAARRALLVAGDHPQVLSSAAFIFGYFGEDIEASMELADRALMLNPSYAKGWYESGTLRLWAGQPDSAISYLEKYLRLSPKAGTAGAYMGLGMAHFFARRFEDATRMLLLAKQERPNWPPTHRFLAACYAHMGQLADARATVERLRAITPLLIPSATHWRNADQREFFLSGLRLAVGDKLSSRDRQGVD